MTSTLGSGKSSNALASKNGTVGDAAVDGAKPILTRGGSTVRPKRIRTQMSRGQSGSESFTEVTTSDVPGESQLLQPIDEEGKEPITPTPKRGKKGKKKKKSKSGSPTKSEKRGRSEKKKEEKEQDSSSNISSMSPSPVREPDSPSVMRASQVTFADRSVSEMSRRTKKSKAKSSKSPTFKEKKGDDDKDDGKDGDGDSDGSSSDVDFSESEEEEFIPEMYFDEFVSRVEYEDEIDLMRE